MSEMEQRVISKRYDREIFRSEMSWLRRRIGPDGFWYFNVENENQYETADRGGEKLTILVYKESAAKDAPSRLNAWYMFGIQDKEIVGYLGGFIEAYSAEDKIGRGKTSYTVASHHGKGIGGAMEKINESLMQKWANQHGDLTREVRDANMEKIEMLLSIQTDLTKERLDEMLTSRWIWLELYGPNGRGRFERKNTYELIKIYKQGDHLPDLNMIQSKNVTPIGDVSIMIEKWLEEDWLMRRKD